MKETEKPAWSMDDQKLNKIKSDHGWFYWNKCFHLHYQELLNVTQILLTGTQGGA